MRLVAAAFGKLDEQVAQEKAEAAWAVTLGTLRATEALKARLRELVMVNTGSKRLAQSWQSTIYPRPPARSLGPTGLVRSKAPRIIDAFSRAQLVRSSDGFFLAIPSPDAPKKFMGKPVSPTNWDEQTYGPLRFVYRRTGPSLLVVDAVKRTRSGNVSKRMSNDGLTKTGKYRKGWSTVVMFFLVPFVRLKQFWDLEREYEKAGDDMIRFIIEAWQ